MATLLINPKTQTLIDAFCRRPQSSLMISGTTSSGAQQIATMIAERLLSDQHRGNIVRLGLKEAEKTIGIDAVRDFKYALSTKIPGSRVGRVAIVERADALTVEAQNTLLKILEEPPTNTVIILQSALGAPLLQTIASRVHVISVLPITKHQAFEHAAQAGAAETAANRAYAISEGEALLFVDMLSGAQTEATDHIEDAKLFLGASVFERLQQQKTFATQEKLVHLVTGLRKIATAALRNSPQGNMSGWKTISTEVRECEELLKRNTPPKLVFLRLATHV